MRKSDIPIFCTPYFYLASVFLVVFHLSGYTQIKNPGISKPGEVVFEDPFAKFPQIISDANEYSKILLEDSKGFIWFVKNGTLYRYDGYELKDFLKVPVGVNDIIASSIASMAEDSFGYIWIGCHRRQGVFRYDPRKETFERFPRDKHDPKDISEAEVWTICPDHHSRVWIGTYGYGNGRGLYMYDYKTDSIEEFRHDPDDPESLPSDGVFLIHIDKHDNIWLPLQDFRNDGEWGLFHFDPDSKKFTEFRLETPGKEPQSILTDRLFNDENGNLYLALWRPFMLIKVPGNQENIVQNTSESYGLIKNYEIVIEGRIGKQFDIDQHGAIWVTANQFGIYRIDPNTRELTDNLPFVPIPRSSYFLSNVICDASGIVWYSYVHGLQHYIPTKRKFTTYNPDLFETIGLSEATVNSVYEDPDGMLWLGMNSSLVRYNPENNELKRFDPPPHIKENPNRLSSIIPGGDEELYIAATNCMYIFNIQKEHFETIPFPLSFSNMYNIIESLTMYKDQSGSVYIGTDPGCMHVDAQMKKAEFLYDDDRNHLFTGGNTRGIIEDKYGNLWFGSEFGLTCYNPKDSTSIKIVHDPLNPNGLASPNISALLYDNKGNIWIGYKNAGLSKVAANEIDQLRSGEQSISLTHFSRANGLPDLNIMSLVEDHVGNIWIASRLGLSVLNVTIEEISTFKANDGIQKGFFHGNFFINSATGKIWIGMDNRAISFTPERMPFNTYAPPIVITEFRLHNQEVSVSDTSVLKQAITYTDHLDLSYRENFLFFRFAALDFTNPEKNQYKYFMEGVDQDTMYSGFNRTAEYRNLQPGKYNFWVTGSNSDDIWNPSGTSISIHIHPPWYRSAAAQSFYALFMLVIVLAYVRIRTEKLRKEKMVLEKKVASRTEELQVKNEQITEMEHLKTQFFTDISHEIRTPLSLISGPLDKLMHKARSDDEEKSWLSIIKRNSKRLLQLVNQLLDISRLDSGHMKLILVEDDVLKHLKILSSEFLSLAESRGISLFIEVPENRYLTYYDKEKLDKVLANLLSNAFKFTPENGTVHIRIKILEQRGDSTNTELRIIVADTGPGIPAGEREKIFDRFYRAEGELYEDAGGTGIGLSLTRDLIHIMKGEISVKSPENSGAVFVATMPLGLEHLEEKEYILKDMGSDRDIPENEEAKSANHLPKTDADAEIEILLVEDNEDLLEFISESLSGRYKIELAENGQIGLDKAKAIIPDLIITDVMMPEMDGMEFCSKVKDDELTSHIPIIMLTAKSTSDDKMEGLKLGADAYMFKPFRIEELIIQINNLLEQRERLRKKYSNMIGLDWGDMAVTTIDEKFLKKATGIISENLHKFEFDVGQLQEQMFMSRSNLFKKMKALTGDSPGQLIRVMRLKTAASYIENGEENITEVALNTGFSNPSYFAKCFKEQFGKTPREYKKLKG